MKSMRTRRMLCATLIASAITVLLFTGQAYAQDDGTGAGAPASVEPATTAGTSAPSDDGGNWELGLEGSAGDLPQATAAERYAMRYWIDDWFDTRFDLNEVTAWEEDFKREALGGTENQWLDSVDMQFYVGNGVDGRITFANDAHHDDAMVASNDCFASWGDEDNEWLALVSSRVLSNSGLSRIANCMNGQHLILGGAGSAGAHDNWWGTHSYAYGLRLDFGWNQAQAWFGACDVADRGRVTRALAEEPACLDDNPYRPSVCSITLDNDYAWYTHICGLEPAAATAPETAGGVLPVYSVEAYDEPDAAADFANLGLAFGIPVSVTLQAASALGGTYEPPTSTVAGPFMMAHDDTGSLIMDSGSGLYAYVNTKDLWTASSVLTATTIDSSDPRYITAMEARTVADAFLASHGLVEPGALFAGVITDTTGAMLTRAPEASPGAIAAAEVTAAYQVVYERRLALSPVATAGITPLVSIGVVGPGAQLKVYLPLQEPEGASSLTETLPIGAVGGWRAVSLAMNEASEPLTTTLISTATADALFLALADAVTMNSIYTQVLSPTVVSHTVAYWEMVAGAHQGELIPVYGLDVAYTDGASGQAESERFYVPAATKYMRPLARILNAPAEMTVGVTVTLEAPDASLTLEANGIGSAGQFPFVMGYLGAAGDFRYEWYMGAVAAANRIGACDDQLTCMITAPTTVGARNGFDVTLLVKDTSSPNQSESAATATIALTPLPYYLPVTRK